MFLRSLVLFFALSLPLQAQGNWLQIYTDVRRGDIYSLDKSSIRTIDQYRYYWLHVRLGRKQDRTYSLLSYNSVDCNNLRNRRRTLVYLGKDGETNYESNPQGYAPLQRVKPEDPLMKVIEVVCRQ